MQGDLGVDKPVTEGYELEMQETIKALIARLVWWRGVTVCVLFQIVDSACIILQNLEVLTANYIVLWLETSLWNDFVMLM